MDLEAAIAQLVSLGERDPVELARKLIAREGNEWLQEQLMAYAEDLVAELARRRLGAVRRSAELALRPGDETASAQLKVTKAWVPGSGWKRAADLTADDLVARAVWYEKLAGAAAKRAAWCRDVAELMRREGARTLGRLRVALPPLPDSEEHVLGGAS